MTYPSPDMVSPADVLAPSASLPTSRESEMAVLGAMIFDNEVIGDVIEVVGTPEEFAYPAHRSIFETILALHHAGKPIDLVVLRDHLAREKRLEQVGGADYLMALVEGVPNAATAVEYASSVHEKYVLRNIGLACRQVQHTIAHVTENVDQVREEAERVLFQALGKGEKSIAAPITEDLLEILSDLDKKGGGQPEGLSTGWHELDHMLSGLQPGLLYVVAGRPSMGKTSFALNIVEHVALGNGDQKGKPVLLYSLEMSRKQIVTGLLCSHARVDSMALKNNLLTEEEVGRIAKSAEPFSEAPLLIDDAATLSALELRTRTRRLKARSGLELLVVDYLQKMNATQGNRAPETRQHEIAMITSGLKSLAKELHIPVIALSQFNRGTEGRDDRRPMLSDLRESGAIEQDADVVIGLYREEYYSPDTEKKGIAEVRILKNRTGAVGNIELAFLKQWTRFENLSRRASEPAMR